MTLFAFYLHSCLSQFVVFRVAVNHKLKIFARDCATYRHDCWVFERQSEGWSYGLQVNEDRRKHPNIRPFHMLPEEVWLKL